MKPAIISKVTPNSIATEIGFEPGDAIVAINGTKLRDLIDYQYLCADEYLELEVLDKKGTTHYIEIEKEDGEKIGLIGYKCHAYSHILPGNVTIGHWGHDSRGSNQFLNYTTMVTIGDYTENLGALAAKWQCETV